MILMHGLSSHARLPLRSLGLFVFALAAMPASAQVDSETLASFTEDQVAAGLAAYQANCATSCHQNDMSGNGPIAALRGTPFTSVWNNRSVADLVTAMRTQMPPTNVGGLPLQTYVDLAAFILSANGGEIGENPLTANSDALISQFTSGNAPAPSIFPVAANAGEEVTGITVEGTVPNFRPVSEAELQNPSPNDWLMFIIT